jgi:UDP-glucose 4-epimerase
VSNPVSRARGATIAVVGAGGFIGSAVTRVAVESGASVVAISCGPTWRLSDVLDSGEVTSINVPSSQWWDGAFLAGLQPILEGADAVAHLAYARPTPGGDLLAQERATNVAGTAALAEIAGALKKRFVFTSSADCYGQWFSAPVAESQAPEPRSPYAVAKLEAERRIASVKGSGVVLRLSTVYGPGEEGPRAIPSFIRAFLSGGEPTVHGDGSDVKDYIYVDDAARAIVEACLSPGVSPLLNVGSGTGRTTKEILETVASAVGELPRATYVPSPRPASRLVLDVSLARREIGLADDRAMDDCLAEQARWFSRRLETGAAA